MPLTVPPPLSVPPRKRADRGSYTGGTRHSRGVVDVFLSLVWLEAVQTSAVKHVLAQIFKWDVACLPTRRLTTGALSLHSTTVMNTLLNIFTGRNLQRTFILELNAKDTLARASEIIAQHAAEGATADSMFIGDQLDELNPSKSPNAPQTVVEVINSDSFVAARKIIEGDSEAKGRTTVLNLASDIKVAGGWKTNSLSKTQVDN